MAVLSSGDIRLADQWLRWVSWRCLLVEVFGLSERDNDSIGSENSGNPGNTPPQKNAPQGLAAGNDLAAEIPASGSAGGPAGTGPDAVSDAAGDGIADARDGSDTGGGEDSGNSEDSDSRKNSGDNALETHRAGASVDAPLEDETGDKSLADSDGDAGLADLSSDAGTLEAALPVADDGQGGAKSDVANGGDVDSPVGAGPATDKEIGAGVAAVKTAKTAKTAKVKVEAPKPAAVQPMPADLVMMRRVALGCLLLAAMIFVGAEFALSRGAGPWVGYVSAAAEAGMVGGLADWFAVTALFRHPLGLKIPHTALVPNRKKELGSSLAEFMGTHFFTTAALESRLRAMDIPYRFGRWLSHDNNIRVVDGYATEVLQRAITVMRDDSVRPAIARIVLQRAEDTEVSPLAGRVLDELVLQEAHQRAADVCLEQAVSWLNDNDHVVREAVAGRAPDWTPRWVDDMVASRLHGEIVKLLTEIRHQPGHVVRGQLTSELESLATKMREDPETMARMERAKMRLLQRDEVHSVVAETASAARKLILEMLADEDSLLRVQLRKLIADVAVRLRDDKRVAAKVEDQMISIVVPLIVSHRSEITALVTETIDRWDGEQAANRIERHVGRDLQFIRINGTIVGAIVGLVLHTVSHAIGG